MATDRHPGTTNTPGGFKATGFVASKPGDALNVNPAPGINWLQKYGEMDWGNALKTGDFGLTDAERATQLANTVRINNEEMAKAQAARAAAAQVSQAPPRMPAPIQGPMRQGGSYPYQIPNRTFEWSTTPQEQMALAGRMNRQDLQPLLSSGEYGPLAGQNYRYTPQGTTQINYGPGGGDYMGFPPWQGLPPWQPPVVPPVVPPRPPRVPPTIGDPPPVVPPTVVRPPYVPPTTEETDKIFDRNNPGPTTVADIGRVRTDPVTGQTITDTGISLADAAKNYGLTPEESYRVTYSPYGAEERGQGPGISASREAMMQDAMRSYRPRAFTPLGQGRNLNENANLQAQAYAGRLPGQLDSTVRPVTPPAVIGVDRGLQQAQAQKAQRDAAAAVVRQTQQRDRGRDAQKKAAAQAANRKSASDRRSAQAASRKKEAERKAGVASRAREKAKAQAKAKQLIAARSAKPPQIKKPKTITRRPPRARAASAKVAKQAAARAKNIAYEKKKSSRRGPDMGRR
jgi:hypothetical protein